jgi:ABC transporter transmembrane region
VRVDEAADFGYDELAAHVSVRCVLGLFRRYAGRLVVVLGLILVATATGIGAPFLLRAIIDDALPHRDLHLLALLAAGLIGLACVETAISVVQVLITSKVGQAIMHEVRVRVYAHLQSLSLGFFTATRTGEVQSRIASDIGGLPTWAQRRDAKCALKCVARMPRQVRQRVDLSDGHPFWPGADLDDLLPCLDLAFGEYAAIKAWSSVRHEQSRHARLADTHSDAIAGDSRLGDLEYGLADLVAIADAHLVIGQPVDREVLPEGARLQVVALQFRRPVVVGRQLVHQHRTVFSSVAAEVTLAVAVDVEPTDHAGSSTGVFQAPV